MTIIYVHINKPNPPFPQIFCQTFMCILHTASEGSYLVRVNYSALSDESPIECLLKSFGEATKRRYRDEGGISAVKIPNVENMAEC